MIYFSIFVAEARSEWVKNRSILIYGDWSNERVRNSHAVDVCDVPYLEWRSQMFYVHS